MKKFLIVCFALVAFVNDLYAQDTLPAITVKSINNTVLISWTNPFTTLTTINIQRSADSLKNFTTIGSILDVKNKRNGYADAKPKTLKMFYRVFIALEGGTYLFSKSYRPVKDSIKPEAVKVPEEEKDLPDIKKPEITLPPLPVIKPGYVPSKFIFTDKNNNVVISLKDAATTRYQIKFFDEANKPLFEINKMTDPYLIIEKVNFLRAGMFRFEIYEDGIIMEKHHLFIQKDGPFTNSVNEINRRQR